MNDFNHLKKQFVELYSMTRLQRGMRLLLRAFWLGIAGIIIGWGIHALFGLLPNPASWVLIGLGLALVPIVIVLVDLYPVLFALNPDSRWIRELDQQLGLREQLSTAWEVAEKNDAAKKTAIQNPGGPVSDLLVQEMLSEVPRMQKEVLKEGWYRKSDLVSSIVVLMLAFIILAAALFQPQPNIQTQNQPEAAPQSILPQPDEQQAPPDQQQPGDQAGGESADGAGQQPGDGSAQGNPSAGDQAGGEQPGQTPGSASKGSGTDPQALQDALRAMGSELSQQAGTYDFGKALENLDMEGSAQALEDLNQNLKELSPETRENMAQAMQDAADAIDQAGDPQMSQNMQDAAESLPNAGEDASQALGDVANDLRDMGSAMQSASGANNGAGQGQSTETGNPEPLKRLSDEGGNFDLPQENGAQSDLLSPAPPGAAGEGTASGTLDSTSQAGTDAVQNPILPNSLLWKWRNVVSDYFQR